MNKYLIIILVIAAFFRLWMLGTVPASLYWEETALGYDAYSLWKTGKDFHGNPWPIVAFESFGDYKPSGYFYLAAPFVGILGLNNWSVRLPSALAGIFTVWLMYVISWELFKNRKAALFAALVLALLPWHIQFSRAAFEVNVAVMWLSLGIWLLLLARKKISFVFPAGIAFVLSMYTYHGLRILAPTLVVFFAVTFLRNKLFTLPIIISVIVCTLLVSPILLNIKNPVVAQRFAETSLFSTSRAIEETNALREADGNTPISRLIHHRYWYWGKEIISGMAAHFSPLFLFLKGDGNGRHQTGYTGLLYGWMIIPLAFLLLSKRDDIKRSHVFLTGWTLLATLPPALTNLSPHTLRFLPAAPAIALITGYGIYRLTTIKRVWVFLPLSMLVIGECFAYGFDYFTSYPIRSNTEWQYGYEQMIRFIASRNTNAAPVQVTRTYGRPSMYFLYYLHYDPQLIQQQAGRVPKDQGELLAFDNYSFGPIDLSKKGLAVSDAPLSRGTLIKQIDSPLQRPVFYIYEIE